MKKLFLTCTLLCCTFLCCTSVAQAQLNVNGVAGSDGYAVARASLDLPLLPGLTVTPGASMLTKDVDGFETMYQYYVGANFQLPFWHIASIGGKVGATPKKNDYANYYYDVYGALNIEELFFSVLPLDTFQVGAGFRNTYHKFYNPDYDLTETDVYGFLNAGVGGFDASATYTKAVNFSGEKKGIPLWLDIPNFTAVYYGYLDYSLGLTAGYTYKIVRPYASYTFIKTDGTPKTDDLALGLTLKVLVVDINASVEWFDFSKNNGDRQTFYSLTGGISF